MDCWSILQLADDADERSIKRSYARLLKVTRPDEDAEGFQRLREAYEEALEIARWREDDEVMVEAPPFEPEPAIETPTLSELPDWSRLPQLQPSSTPSAAQQAEDQARALIPGLSTENLPQRWEQALQQDCASAFEQALLRLCFEQPGLRVGILVWAVQQREWLTPWQTVRMAPEQEQALSADLLQGYRQELQAQLEAGQEREFINQLKHYSEQPWLRIFDRRLHWQHLLLQMLHQSQWSLPLFERVCQLFGWDERTGVTPEPEWLWQAVLDRCKEEGFYQNLLARAQVQPSPSSEHMAAHLLLGSGSHWQKFRKMRKFSGGDWQACQQLAEQLTHRHPRLIERLPEPDVFFWHKYLPRTVPAHGWILFGLLLMLAYLLALVPGIEGHLAKGQSAEGAVLGSVIIAGALALLGRIVAAGWALLAWNIAPLDVWLSERLLPRRLSPSGRALLIRHGGLQLAIAAIFWSALGALGAISVLGLGLVGLTEQGRTPIEPADSFWRSPWQSLCYWTQWSTRQWCFAALMLIVSGICVQFFPGFPLTSSKQP
ncbi:J domain-containing protein [Pseudomonas vanderleydeniana]|uniref:J domain-containing protein n=1 Tax=Pseudomonas vanderleydeniana TaxID=2745495 RepID=A0A9E6PJB6_9PSED|nr:J domain-containing protein [Pseudomonas vanderleydeniana]QXI27772.1 J domain-containing protein [Pseudomonas vanderleydeniana]